jgi:Fe2+ or Zn2+ uptake regulation protein
MKAMSSEILDRELSDALRERGHRVTLPRLLVHRHVRASDRHLTAEQLHDELARELPSLSLATVYATLEVLEELGLVRRVGTLGGATLYDSRTAAHHHAICRRCGGVTDVEAPAARIPAPAGFQVERAEVQLVGLCAACASAG